MNRRRLVAIATLYLIASVLLAAWGKLLMPLAPVGVLCGAYFAFLGLLCWGIVWAVRQL